MALEDCPSHTIPILRIYQVLVLLFWRTFFPVRNKPDVNFLLLV